LEFFGNESLVQVNTSHDFFRLQNTLATGFEIVKKVEVFEKSLDAYRDLVTRNKRLGVGDRDWMSHASFECGQMP
jgi:hypothetical protein